MPILANPVFWVVAILVLWSLVAGSYVWRTIPWKSHIIKVPLKTLPKDFDGLRIALISDLRKHLWARTI